MPTLEEQIGRIDAARATLEKFHNRQRQLEAQAQSKHKHKHSPQKASPTVQSSKSGQGALARRTSASSTAALSAEIWETWFNYEGKGVCESDEAEKVHTMLVVREAATCARYCAKHEDCQGFASCESLGLGVRRWMKGARASRPSHPTQYTAFAHRHMRARSTQLTT